MKKKMRRLAVFLLLFALLLSGCGQKHNETPEGPSEVPPVVDPVAPPVDPVDPADPTTDPADPPVDTPDDPPAEPVDVPVDPPVDPVDPPVEPSNPPTEPVVPPTPVDPPSDPTAPKRTWIYKYYIKVNVQANTVTVYEPDANDYFTVPVRAMICSTGTATPTSGVFEAPGSKGVVAEWWSLFGNVYGHYVTHITGNILFHSVPYTKNGDNSSLEYWEFDKLGTAASMGCVRLQVVDAKWIHDNAKQGNIQAVEFYSSSDPGPLGKPMAPKISDNEACRNWDPTDPDANNPWKNQPTTVKVPDFRGMDEHEAKEAVITNGLIPGEFEYVASEYDESGRIVSQSIEPETTVEMGTVINFTVSSGAKTEEP